MITYPQGSIFSDQRRYLRVERSYLVFDICAAPFAHGFFVSWWQGEIPNVLRRILTALPFIGKIMERAFFIRTYYQIDVEQMFKDSVHHCVLEAIDAITTAQGIRGLGERERQPCSEHEVQTQLATV